MDSSETFATLDATAIAELQRYGGRVRKMDSSETLATLDATAIAELHAIKVDLIALRNDVIELLSANREVTDFIQTMQAVVSQMGDNPMLKAFLPAGFGSQFDMPKLPGMEQ